MTTNSPQENSHPSAEKAYIESPSAVEEAGTRVDDSVLAWAKKVGRGIGLGSPSTPAREECLPSRHEPRPN